MIRENLNRVISALKQYPIVQDAEIVFNNGIDYSLIEKAENNIGFEIDEFIKAVYLESDGLELKINYNQQIYELYKSEISKYVNDPFFILPEDEENRYLGLKILKFEEVFFTRYFNFSDTKKIMFNAKEYTLKDLSFNIKPFDLFSGFTCAAFFIDHEEKKLKVLLLDSHFDDWTNSRCISFMEYWNMLVKGYFSCDIRKRNLLIDYSFGESESIIDQNRLVNIPDLFNMPNL